MSDPTRHGYVHLLSQYRALGSTATVEMFRRRTRDQDECPRSNQGFVLCHNNRSQPRLFPAPHRRVGSKNRVVAMRSRWTLPRLPTDHSRWSRERRTDLVCRQVYV